MMGMIHTRFSYLTNHELIKDVFLDQAVGERELELASRLEQILDESGDWEEVAATKEDEE